MITLIDAAGTIKKPNDFSLAVLTEHIHETVPEKIDQTLSIPGRDGLFYFGSDLGVRQFEIPMIVKPQKSKMDLQKRLRELASFLIDGSGKPKLLELYFDYEPDKYYLVRLNGRVAPERILTIGNFTMQLVAHDPYAYAPQTYKPTNVVTDMEYGYEPPDNVAYFGDAPVYHYPNVEEFEWTEAIHHVGLYNYSSISTPLSMEIEGKVHNPRITNQTTGEVLNLPYINYQKMVIDAEELDVSINGEYNYTQVSGKYLHLTSGKNDLVFEGISPNANVRFIWKHKFI